MRTISKYIVGIGIFSLTFLPHLGLAADIEVTLKGFTATGGLQVALYDNEAAYKAEKMFGGLQMRAHANPLRVLFADVPPGTYSIAIFHDANENQELDADMLGTLTEAYGFSNNARGTQVLVIDKADLTQYQLLELPPSFTFYYGTPGKRPVV